MRVNSFVVELLERNHWWCLYQTTGKCHFLVGPIAGNFSPLFLNPQRRSNCRYKELSFLYKPTPKSPLWKLNFGGKRQRHVAKVKFRNWNFVNFSTTLLFHQRLPQKRLHQICSPFNSVSNSVSGIVLRAGLLGDIQGRTRTSDVISHRFFVQPSSFLRIFFATAVHSQNPTRP